MANKTSSFDQQSLNYGVAQENKLYIQGIKMKEDEREWIQGNDCIVCDLSFSKYGKAHHWLCGNSVCKSCSNKMINDKKSCDLCFKRIQMVDQEQLKKQQIKTKKEHIKELKKQVQVQEEKNDLMKIQITELQQLFERQKKEHEQQEKILDDQLGQKINNIRQQMDSNKRLEQNIEGEKSIIEELGREIFEISGVIERKKFDIIFKIKQKEEQDGNLLKEKKNLEDLQLNFEQKQAEITQLMEQKQQSENLLSNQQQTQVNQDYQNSQPPQEKKHKEKCIIF